MRLVVVEAVSFLAIHEVRKITKISQQAKTLGHWKVP